jgi:RNA polymerase sigma-70 factor, ECF subfamily
MDLLEAAFTSSVDRLRSIARARGLGPSDAEDAVQDAFARFLELGAKRKISTVDEARAFLAVVVVNFARNARRRHHRKRPHLEVDRVAGLRDPTPLADERIDDEESLAKLRSCIATLDEVPRRIVSLRIIGELSGADVAKSVDLRPGHVAVLLHRAKKDLCRCMLTRPL